MTEDERRVVLVLGSGATFGGGFRTWIDGTNFVVPMDQNFWATPAVQSVFTEDQFPALHHYREQLRDSGGQFRGDSLEATWAYVDMLLKFCISGVAAEKESWETLRGAMEGRAESDSSYQNKMCNELEHSRMPSMAAWELLDLVRRVFEDVREEQQGDAPLRRIVGCVRSEVGAIVTFNYDTSVEQVLSEGFHYPVERLSPNQGSLPVYKLHGSLNWQTDAMGPNPSIEFRTGLDSARMEHGSNQNEYSQPEVVGPTQFKQEITVDTQNDFRTRHYRWLWREAASELRDATHLVFIGFSFPPTDYHVQVLFRWAHANRTVPLARLVVCHHHDERLLPLVNGIYHVEPVDFMNGIEDLGRRVGELVALLDT